MLLDGEFSYKWTMTVGGVAAVIYVAVYAAVGEIPPPAPLPPLVGWLQPANEPTPANSCDRLPPGAPKPNGPIILMGDTAFAPIALGNAAAIKIGDCAPVSVQQGPNGIKISADIYSRQGELIGQIQDNGYSVSGSESLVVEKSGDLSALVVHDAQRTELLYVRYLNPQAIRLRGILSCPIPRLITVVITDSGLIAPGNNIFRQSCLSGANGMMIR